MLTKTTVSAIRALLYIAQHSSEVLSPKRVAEQLSESPSYLAKVSRLLVRAGILRAERGVKGGAVLTRTPDRITLLAIVEACQGTLMGNYCRADSDLNHTCAFHQAAVELHLATTSVLSKWTLSQLLKRPRPDKLQPIHTCLIAVASRVNPFLVQIPQGGKPRK